MQSPTPRQLVGKLNGIAKSRGFDFVSRPWNRYEPDDSDWWLVPSADWPAYKHAKLFVRQLELEKDAFFISLHVEKGLGHSVIAAYQGPKGRRLIMGDDWAWQQLLDSLNDGSHQRELLAMVEQSDVEPLISIEGLYVDDPDSFDPYLHDFKRDRYLFRVSKKSGLLDIKSSSVEARLLGTLDDIASLHDLGTALRKLTDNPWLWLDYMSGFDVRSDQGDSVPPDPELIWTGLSAFERWFSSAP